MYTLIPPSPLHANTHAYISPPFFGPVFHAVTRWNSQVIINVHTSKHVDREGYMLKLKIKNKKVSTRVMWSIR